MPVDALDPVIHVPARLRLVATLAALPPGDALGFTRLQEMLDLTPGNLITHLRKLEEAGYIRIEKTGNGVASRTSATLTHQGRAALDVYAASLRDLLAGVPGSQQNAGDRGPARPPYPAKRQTDHGW
jgi:DNA-binding MarR family transcriptional regulator